jgi:hypothetical protein
MIRSARVLRELEGFTAKYPSSQMVDETDGSITLVIPAYPLPIGFDRPTARIAIRIGSLYPSEKLDLLWVDPTLRRLDGGALPNAMGTNVVLAGQFWTQISWHDNAPHDPQRSTILGFVRGIRLWFAQQMGAVA